MEQEEVQTQTTEAGLSIDTVKEYLNTNNDGKLFMQSLIDSKITKAIETYKNNSVPKLIDEEINKRFPAETAEMKKIKELESKYNASILEANKIKLKNIGLTTAQANNIPIEFVDYLIGDDEESTVSNVSKFKDIFNLAVESQVNSKFSDNGRDMDANSKSRKDNFTPAEIAKMMSDPKEYSKNKVLIQKYLNQ